MAFHFIFSSFYPDSVDANQVWEILDWFMAFAVLATLVVTFIHKGRIESGTADTNKYICLNVAFYTTAWLAIWFFWNWFDDLALGDELQSELNLTFWGFIDPMFIVLVGSVSAYLWRHDPGN